MRNYYRPLRPLLWPPLCSFFMLSSSVLAFGAERVEFDPDFLKLQDPAQLDLSRFNNGASVLPGDHVVDVWMNGDFVARETLTFVDKPGGEMAVCLPDNLLHALPLAEGVLKPPVDDTCQALQSRIPQATHIYDSGLQRLDVTLPQILVRRSARGTVPPSQWDSGVTAAMLGYNLGLWDSSSGGSDYRQAFGSVNAGLNVGAWYLRHNGSYRWQEKQGQSYDTLNTYLQRDIPALRGRLLLGESNTAGYLFDTVPFTGIALASDDRMLPQSLRGYAPEIRGIARTNALVSVRQNNQVIYETTVTPGAFVIDDLYPTGYGGNLAVTVKEADGEEQHFDVSYASVAQLLRPGGSRYSFTGGQLRSDRYKNKPGFAEMTWLQGINNWLTGYAGSQFAPDYYAMQVGTAFGSRIGALSVDMTQSRYRGSDAKSLQGQSYRISYSKYLPETGSNFSLATYRYSTRGYLSIQDAMLLRDYEQAPARFIRPRNRGTLTFSQNIGDRFGQLYLSGSVQNYWGRSGHDRQYQGGYTVTQGRISWGVSVNRTRDVLGRYDNTWMLNLSMPLGASSKPGNNWLRAGINRDSQGKFSEQLSLTGAYGDNQQINYGITATEDSYGHTAGTLNSQYRNAWNTLSASVSKASHYRSLSAGMTGTIVGHSGGVNFSPYSSDTFAIVEARGAEGAKVNGMPGIQVDARGYALVPNLNPYQLNDVNIDPKGASDGVEFSTTRKTVAPYSGAIVRLHYGVKKGNTLLLDIRGENNQPVPFGAAAIDSQGTVIGYIGQAGQLYALVSQPEGKLIIQWGEQGENRCWLNYRVLSNGKNSTLLSRPAVCQRI